MSDLKRGTVVYNTEHGVGVVTAITESACEVIFENGRTNVLAEDLTTPTTYEEFDEYFAMVSKGSRINQFLEESFGEPKTVDLVVEEVVEPLNESPQNTKTPSVSLNRLLNSKAVDTRVLDTLSKMMRNRNV